VTDVTHPDSGTIVLNSKKDGPLMPAFDTQAIGNALGWGLVYDTPNSFVWEIGHTSPFTSPASQFCIPGQTICDSFDAPAWAGMLPIQIKDVTFGDGSSAQHWAAVSDTGGKAEIFGNSFVGPTPCPGYGGPFCIYPWYSSSPNGFHYGVHYPDTTNDYGPVRTGSEVRRALRVGLDLLRHCSEVTAKAGGADRRLPRPTRGRPRSGVRTSRARDRSRAESR
jgi:hypothetical protein